MVSLKYNGNPFFCLFSDPLWSSSNECREDYSTTLSFSVQCWTEDWTSQGVCSISELVIPKCIHSAGKRVSVLYNTSNGKEIWVQNIIAGKRKFRYHFLCFHWVLDSLQFTPATQRWKQEPKPQEAEKLLVFLPLELIPKCTLGSRGFFSCAAGCFVPGAKALVTVKTVTGLTQTIECWPGERKVACSIPWNGRSALRVLNNWGRR